VDKILDEAEQKIFNIGEEGSRMKQGFQGMDTLVVELLDRVQEMADNPNDITGCAHRLLRPGPHDLRFAGRRPDRAGGAAVHGQDGTGHQHCRARGAERGLPVAVFSMEMGASQLAVRIVGSIGRIDQSHLRTGKLTDDEWPRLTEAIEKLRNISLHIDETRA
jgi:replicative DNA helicase